MSVLAFVDLVLDAVGQDVATYYRGWVNATYQTKGQVFPGQCGSTNQVLEWDASGRRGKGGRVEVAPSAGADWWRTRQCLYLRPSFPGDTISLNVAYRPIPRFFEKNVRVR